MKKTLIISIITILTSCKKEEAVVSDVTKENSEINTVKFGKEIFEGKGMCATCHKPDVKFTAPSIKEIATIYRNKKASVSLFLQGESEPIVDALQYEIMKANLEITKTMTEEELKALEKYMLSFK